MENGRDDYINISIRTFCGNCTETMEELVYDFLMRHPKLKHSDIIDLCVLINSLVGLDGTANDQ